MKHWRGYTLIEIMISIAIFAIVAAIIAAIIPGLFRAEQSISLGNQRLENLQMAMTIIERDIEQIVNRTILDDVGRTENAVLTKNNDFIFTRGGFVNPEYRSQRSTLQRVAYRVYNQELIRLTWPELDRQQRAQDPQQRVILNNVTALRWRFLDQRLESFVQWPPVATQIRVIPTAIELDIELADFGRLTRLFIVPEQQFDITIDN